jgi:chromosome segregation ATPase
MTDEELIELTTTFLEAVRAGFHIDAANLATARAVYERGRREAAAQLDVLTAERDELKQQLQDLADAHQDAGDKWAQYLRERDQARAALVQQAALPRALEADLARCHDRLERQKRLLSASWDAVRRLCDDPLGAARYSPLLAELRAELEKP